MFVITMNNTNNSLHFCYICSQWPTIPHYILKTDQTKETDIRICNECFNRHLPEYVGKFVDKDYVDQYRICLMLPVSLALSYLCINCDKLGPQLRLIIFDNDECKQHSYCKSCLIYDTKKIASSYNINIYTRKLLNLSADNGNIVPYSVLDSNEQELIKKEHKHILDLLAESIPVVELRNIITDYYWLG